MSNQVFMLPDLGEGLAEADIAEWHVKVGDVVTIDQIVVEVETAKAAVDVPIPFAGTVIELHGKGGDTLKVGTPLITVSGGESVDAVVSANHERYREEERAGSGKRPDRLRHQRGCSSAPPQSCSVGTCDLADCS